MLKRIFTKKFLPVLMLVPALLLITSLLFFSGRDARRFDALTEKIFRQELTGNTLNLHYTLAYPENFGIDHYDVVLPCYSALGTELSHQTLESYMTSLSEINPDRLSLSEQYTHTLLSRFFAQLQEGNSYPYYEEPLSPASGMQSQLPILLAEYTFRTTQDVEDYLALLDQTDEYFSSLLTYEQEKRNAGLLQADTSLQKVREQCYSILSKNELDAGTHFLQTTFQERLTQMQTQELLSEKEIENYLSQNDRLLKTVMQPAYEALADGLFLLMGDGTSKPLGLGSYSQGKEYYAWLVKKQTGSPLSIESAKAVLYPQFNHVYKELQTLLLSREDGLGVWLAESEDVSFPLRTPDEILTDLQQRMAKDFPSLPGKAFASDSPALSVKAVSPSLESYCAPAFYLTPPLDDTDSNVIYINESSTPKGLELYTTLAHEGYPGHLYQSVFSQLNQTKEDTNPARQILWYGGYLEGWAIYVEFIAYDYAAALALERDAQDAAYAYTVEKHNRDMQLCLYAILDIAIHYDNTPYEDIHALLETFGIHDAQATRRVYDYIAEEPANYLKYYLGYLEILRLKENARLEWKDDYSDLRFHSFYLQYGPADFTTLTEMLSQVDF